MFSDMHSESANDVGFDKDFYLNYITFVSSIDYQKNIKANYLWKAAKGWAREHPWLFKPRQLLDKPVSLVVSELIRLREKDAGFFRIKDIGIWLLIADALAEYEGKTSKLLEEFDYDAWKIFKSFTGLLKKRFPYISGDKILPMWLKILNEDGEVDLKNMRRLPLPVDKNVARATFNLIFMKKFDGKVNRKVIENIRSVWKRIADKLDVPVIDFDSPLWTLGGEGCSDAWKSKCKNCPVRSRCRFHRAREGSGS